jgi:hypothetical protein
MMTAADTITTARAPGRRMTKLIHTDSTIDDYDLVRHVNLTEREVDGLDGLGQVLAELQSRSDCAVVRGAIADATRTRHVRRLLHPDRATGEQPTLVERARLWTGLDFDSIVRPSDVDVTDIAACGEIAVALLPAAFRDAACIVQLTSGHSFKPGIRLRLWHWLERPVSGAELTYWLREAPVDPAPFRPAQLIYTATPLFAAGACDPLPLRLARRRGSPSVRVPPAHELQPPPRPPAPVPPAAGSAGSGEYAATILIRALVRIGRAAPGERNPTLFRSACQVAPLIKQGLLAEDTVIEALTGAARRVGIDDEPHRDAEREARKAVRWALEHLGEHLP